MAGLALVAPATLLAAPKPVIAEGAIIGTVKAKFNSTDYGVVAFKTPDKIAAKVWAKSLHKETQRNSYFHKIMGKRVKIRSYG